MTFKDFKKELSGERIEGELFKTVFYSLLISFGVFVILYYFKLQYIENFIPKYGFYIFFVLLSYSLILPSIRQVRAYRQFPCMSGMMVGMTIGTVAGFLPGYFIGATNGMFWGSVFGMGIGIFLGVWNGKCCGIMGIMEGLMAGFMGGLMGAMTAVMMFNDNMKLASVVVFIVCSIITFSLNYMVYFEMKENERKIKEDYTLIILLSLALSIITILFMVFGPRSVLFG